MARKNKEIEEIVEKIIEKDLEETMKQSYLNYAMEVIAARALPDIRDGLKPVQRKSIYTLEELGILHDKPYKKAGRVVGECFVAGTKVFTKVTNKFNKYKLTNIEDLDIGDIVLTSKGDKKITEKYLMEEQDIFHVKTNTFFEAKCTKNQQFKILNKDLCFEWKNAIDLKKGDVIVSNGFFYLEKYKETKEIVNSEMKEAEEISNIPYLLEYIKNKYGEDFLLKYKSSFITKENEDEKDRIKRTSIFNSNLYFDLKDKNFDKLDIIEESARLNLNYVEVTEIIKLDKKEETFDIQVEDAHEFIANGMYVHNCMGKYHPHGDTSIYEAMVRMSQDFVNNLPLVDGHGNWGSIDGDGAAAMRYCVTGDTLINTNDGLIRIDEIVKNTELNSDNDINIKIKSINETINTASKLFNSGKHKTLKIVLNNGLSICGTYNHPLLTFNENNNYEWKLIKDLKVGDRCILSWYSNSELFGDNDNLEEAIKLSKDIFIGPIDFKKILKGTKKYQELFIKELFKDKNFFSHENLEYLKYIQIIMISNFNKNVILNENCLIIDSSNKIPEIKEIIDNGEQIVYSIRVDSKCHTFVGNGFINHNTECRLPKIGNEMIDGLKDKIVPFVPNFDEEEIEPSILPCRFPNLLVNGTDGIAVGMISSIPTHNLKDCIEMILQYMKKQPSSDKKNNPMTNSELLEILKGPDFPTGGSIVNCKDLLDIYTTGEGKIFIRGKVQEEIINNKPCLIINEIPYTYSGNKASLVAKISEVILSKKIDELIEIKDESSKEGIRIVLECKKGSDLTKVLNKLYKFTPLQDTFTVRLNGIIGTKIKTFSLKDYCKYFVDFQEEIYKKEYEIKKLKLNKKKEIYEGLVKSFDYIDIIIDLIRHAEKVEYAKRCLMTGNVNNIKFSSKKNETTAKKFDFTEIQAESILETRLRKLNSLEISDIQDTLNEINKELEFCDKVLSNKKDLYKVIMNRLSKISKEYGTERKTILEQSEIIEYKEEEKIENMYVIYDKYGYIKCLDERTYSKVDESSFDNCKFNELTNTSDNLWCFSSLGNLYQLKLKDMSFNKSNDRGILLETKVNKKIDGDIVFVTNKNTDGKLIFITKKGNIKVVDKKEFESTRMITASTKLLENDEILKILEIKDEDKMLICDSKNYLNFNIKEISELKKTSVGIVSIKTEEEIKDVIIYNSKNTEKILLNKKEYIVSSLKNQKRGSKGTKI